MTHAACFSPDQLLAFPPDAVRGAILYDRIKKRLAESLHQIAEASSSVASIDESRIGVFLDSIVCAPKISSSAFAIYHEILEAADEDDVDRVSRLFAELVNQDFPGPLGFHNLTDEHLGPGNPARYARWADVDPECTLNLIPLSSEEYRQIAATTQEAFALMDAGAPEVSGEIRSLLVEVVFALGGVGARLMFHGLSSFYLWGTVFLNAAEHKTALEVVQTLAHESSHMHLFGAALDSPLVENPDDHLYQSPLRVDPRPMDGIYHATYVTARMHYVLSRLCSSGALSPAFIEQAEHRIAGHIKAFREGYEVVCTQGELTELGQGLFSRCYNYMRPYL
jgi:HEXXH motif-containing protein